MIYEIKRLIDHFKRKSNKNYQSSDYVVFIDLLIPEVEIKSYIGFPKIHKHILIYVIIHFLGRNKQKNFIFIVWTQKGFPR